MIRRTPLKRSAKPLKRTRVKARRAEPRRVSVGRDPKYMEFLRSECRCVVCLHLDRSGFLNVSDQNWMRRKIDPAHGRINGARSKGSDYAALPMCRFHHDQFDGKIALPRNCDGTERPRTKEAFAEFYQIDLVKERETHLAAMGYIVGSEMSKQELVIP